MKHKRTLFLVVSLIIIGVFLAACAPTATPAPQATQAPQKVEVTRVVKQTVKETVVVEKKVEAQKFAPGTKLHIVQWSHFVPNYDKWVDPFAKAWGDANGVDVTVDHISITDLAPTLTAAIAAGDGPTMIEMPVTPSSFVEGLQNLNDVNAEAQKQFGDQAPTCKANSYLPALQEYYGFCHGWVPDPADYDAKLWADAGYPNGPSTFAELLDGGKKIKDATGVPLGLGMSPEIDSEMAARAIIWSFGGSIQDADENVTINSPEVVEAVKYMANLYQNAMTEEVFGWTAASNNQGLIAGELSYILNSISAYRSLQKVDPAAADNVGLGAALKGPRGDQHASAHVWFIYVIPKYVNENDTAAAKAFMLHLVANYNQAVYNSELYNFPAFKSTVPQLYEEGGWLDIDPFGSRPQDKLKVLSTAEDWVTYLGYPGPANPAIAEIYSTHIISAMMGKVARGEMSAEDAVSEAETQVKAIFKKWRDKGLVGGTK